MRPKIKRGAMSEAKWRTTETRRFASCRPARFAGWKTCIIYTLEVLCVLLAFSVSYVWSILIHVMR